MICVLWDTTCQRRWRTEWTRAGIIYLDASRQNDHMRYGPRLTDARLFPFSTWPFPAARAGKEDPAGKKRRRGPPGAMRAHTTREDKVMGNERKKDKNLVMRAQDQDRSSSAATRARSALVQSSSFNAGKAAPQLRRAFRPRICQTSADESLPRCGIAAQAPSAQQPMADVQSRWPEKEV